MRRAVTERAVMACCAIARIAQALCARAPSHVATGLGGNQHGGRMCRGITRYARAPWVTARACAYLAHRVASSRRCHIIRALCRALNARTHKRCKTHFQRRLKRATRDGAYRRGALLHAAVRTLILRHTHRDCVGGRASATRASQTQSVRIACCALRAPWRSLCTARSPRVALARNALGHTRAHCVTW